MTLWPMLAAVLVVAAPVPAQERTRVDLFDKESSRRGYAIIDHAAGRIDTYDKDSRRTGYGVVQADGRVDRYAPDGRRLGTTTPIPRDGGRR